MTTLVTWNCNMAFRKKYPEILRYDPDILVIQECENPDENGEWEEFTDWRWVGTNEHKGLAVFTRDGITLDSPGVETVGGRFTLPVTTSGGRNLVGVWAMNDETDRDRRYIGQVYTTVREYRDFLDGGGDSILAGDFNWNAVWDDSPKYPLCGNLADTVELLDECGLQSVYHEQTDCAFGSETDSTFFMHKSPEKPHHIDYIFLPESAVSSIQNLTVGAFDEWEEFSDHVPVVVDV